MVKSAKQSEITHQKSRTVTAKPNRQGPAQKRTVATPRQKSRPTTKPQTCPMRPGSKLAVMLELLRRKQGVTIDQLVKATGWQKHSVRGALSGAIGKRLAIRVESQAAPTGRVYRVAE